MNLAAMLLIFPQIIFSGAPRGGPRPTVNYVLAYGDSKTLLGVCQSNLSPLMASAGWSQGIYTVARNGATVASMKTAIHRDMALIHSNTVTHVLFNLGVNDVNVGFPDPPGEAQWKTDLGYALDTFRNNWPNVKVYVAKPWCHGCVAADYDTLSDWIDAVLATRSTWAFVGMDERTWLDDTNTSDGTHYNAAGGIECAAQWWSVIQ